MNSAHALFQSRRSPGNGLLGGVDRPVRNLAVAYLDPRPSMNNAGEMPSSGRLAYASILVTLSATRLTVSFGTEAP